MRKPDKTTIQVSWETVKKLCTIGRKGETYDEIIRKLLEKAGIN